MATPRVVMSRGIVTQIWNEVFPFYTLFPIGLDALTNIHSSSPAPAEPTPGWKWSKARACVTGILHYRTQPTFHKLASRSDPLPPKWQSIRGEELDRKLQ